MNIRERSGSVNSDDPLVAFLYLLIRDHVHPGDIEDLMKKITKDETCEFSNGWLAEYARDIASRLKI